jgi:branched-subunit amino acid aminotransferase/4-amino-4-deoxychorismate lyase
MTTDYFAVNGRVVPAAEATISVLDLGFLRGVGAFETLRTYGGHPHALTDHLRRLWESAAAFGIAPFFSEGDVRRLLAEILQRSGHAELRANFVVSPGEHTSGVFGASTPTWVIIARDVHAPPESWYDHGVAAVTFEATRHLPTLKTTNYLVGKTGLALAEKAGAHEAFYVSGEGYVTEGVTSNVLIVQGKRLMTPVADCLPGITKGGIRPLAEAAGLTWYECNLTRDDIYTADEVWITSAVRELMPIVTVDGKAIHDGKVGPWAKRLRRDYRALCAADALRDARVAGMA